MFARKKDPAMMVWEHHERAWGQHGYPIGGLDGCVAITAYRTARFVALVREWELVALRSESDRIRRHEPQQDIVNIFDFGEPVYLFSKESMDVRDPDKRRRAAIAIARAEVASMSGVSEVPSLPEMIRSDEYAASCVTIEQYNTLYDFRTLGDCGISVAVGAGDREATGKWLGMLSMWDSIAVNCGTPLPALVLQMSEKYKIDLVEATDRLSVAVLLGDADDASFKPRTCTLYRDEVRNRVADAMVEKMGLQPMGLTTDISRAMYAWREYRVARPPEMNEAL